MRKIVARNDLEKVIANLNELDCLVWDTETTGLGPYHGSRMFSLAIADLMGNSWYFNFHKAPDIADEFVLDKLELKPLMDRERLWIAHNAKFDLHFCAQADIFPNGLVADTRTLARLYQNNCTGQRPYSLDACAKRWLNEHKDDRVMTWMNENNAYMASPTGKNYMFDLVPFEIISEYAMIDAEVTSKLYLFLADQCMDQPMWDVEIALTRVIFEMERRGILVDQNYIHQAKKHDHSRRFLAGQRLIKILGDDWADSAKCIAPVLKEKGFMIPQTETGRDQISDKVLRQRLDDELVQALLEYRDSSKRVETYWHNYQQLPDSDDVIHPDIDQAGTVTGRMSCRNPNLQNIPTRKEEQSDYPIRRAFKARDGFALCSIDYKAVEFRLALEYSGQIDVIERIKEGEDPHQATAEVTGLTRANAKTLNFALIYGAGAAKLADQLGVSVQEAHAIKRKYFDGMPKLEAFLLAAKDRLQSRRQVQNAFGRRYNFETFMYEGKERNNSYKAANLICQGTAADVMKRAMVECADYLRDSKSRMLLTIHDELIFEIHMDDFWFIPDLAQKMAEAYPHKYLPLECSIEVGPNLCDMETYVVEAR